MSMASGRLSGANARQRGLAQWTASKHSTARNGGGAAIGMVNHDAAAGARVATVDDRTACGRCSRAEENSEGGEGGAPRAIMLI
ncbi:hypothetical protein [Paraburkholderia aromaticivorans]|uniref:hypothetical protein n=1 Tax=Paraburkholderia aromaticivorans TaxID=2026199 RepID=UPI001456127C|nr:hypothetical protein [Paraburkholderia aromaticivorans]